MKRVVAVLLCVLIMLTAGTVHSGNEPAMDREEQEALMSHITGWYEVIGRHPDSRKIYSGRLYIGRNGSGLILEKTVGGVDIMGEASVQPAGPDQVPVLRATWKQGKIKYEATYIISSDLDNHPHLTGYVYRADKRTRTPGIEALFFENQGNGK